MSLIYIKPYHSVYLSPIPSTVFNHDNWGKVNTFDNVIDEVRPDELVKFEESYIYTSFVMVFKEGSPWEDTPFFRRALRRLEKNGHAWQCRSQDEILKRLNEDIVMLYESIKEFGFMRQNKIKNIAAEDCVKSKILSRFVSENYPSRVHNQHEIKVGIDECGNILFLDGRHRFSIARLLNVSEIPVRVVFRHRNMVELREALEERNLQKKHSENIFNLSHPDLNHIMISPTSVRACQALAWSLGFPEEVLKYDRKVTAA